MGKRRKLNRNQPTLEDKVREVDANFVDEVLMLSGDQLKERLFGLVKYDEELLDAKTKDGDLKDKKGVYDSALKSYSEPLKANKIKRKLIFQLLETRGTTPDAPPSA